MQINIHSKGFATTIAIKRYAESRLRLALNHLSQVHLQRVSFHLSDENGPKGGRDKRCLLEFALPGGQDIVIRDTQPDLYAAIDRAIDRAVRTLHRQLRRQQQYRHEVWAPDGSSQETNPA